MVSRPGATTAVEVKCPTWKLSVSASLNRHRTTAWNRDTLSSLVPLGKDAFRTHDPRLLYHCNLLPLYFFR
jgi:hypothetical protein